MQSCINYLNYGHSVCIRKFLSWRIEDFSGAKLLSFNGGLWCGNYIRIIEANQPLFAEIKMVPKVLMAK